MQVWVRAKDYALAIYKQVLPLLPPEEKWNLNQQLRRWSLSISANIAEGYGLFYYQDNARFCYNARGSLEAGDIPETLDKQLENEGEEIDKMLNGYISYLKKSKQGANEPGVTHVTREESGLYLTESYEDLTDTKSTIP